MTNRERLVWIVNLALLTLMFYIWTTKPFEGWLLPPTPTITPTPAVTVTPGPTMTPPPLPLEMRGIDILNG